MHHPRRGSLPLLFLLSFAAIFLYSYHYHSSLPLSHPQNADLTPLAPRCRTPTPTSQNFTFTIKVLTFDRIDSLRRCLRSLAAADYAGDRADIHVFVDHFRELDPVNGSALLDRKLEDSRRILDLVDRFDWRHGQKLVHYRTGNAGLQAQWLEAWWPVSDHDFAFVVEDDLEVSPLYYKFLKGLIMRFYYDPSNYSPSIFGASLQRPRFVAGKHGNKLLLDSETRLFLYQLVGTWGQLLFPKPWKEFRLWYDEHRAKGIKPLLLGMVSTGWYKKMGERIWTPWFIKFVQYRGYYNIYTSFPHERALSTSHRDAGVNYGKSAGPDSTLLDESSLDFNLWEMSPLRDLKWYDFCFREVFPGKVIRSYDDLGSVLDSVQRQKTVALVSLYRTTEKITRNLLCHLERMGIQNSIFVGGSIEFLLDLARRGYPVIDSDQLINSTRSYKPMDLQPSDADLIKEIWVKASVIKKCLELGYDSWVIDGNVIPTSSSFAKPTDPSCSFFAAEDVELLSVKSSPTSLKVWVDAFIVKVAAAGKSLLDSNSLSVEHRHFAYFAVKALGEAGVRVSRLDELAIGVKLGAANQTDISSGKKMVLWSPEMALDSVQRELETLQLWLIDGDSSCVAVVCHPQYIPT